MSFKGLPSLQFLSMKLATVNPRMDFNMEALLSKEVSGIIYPTILAPLMIFPNSDVLEKVLIFSETSLKFFQK